MLLLFFYLASQLLSDGELIGPMENIIMLMLSFAYCDQIFSVLKVITLSINQTKAENE